MANWGDGYKQGYHAAAIKIMRVAGVSEVERTYQLKKFMDGINKDFKGNPSKYAVANKCCGGVDAHDVGC